MKKRMVWLAVPCYTGQVWIGTVKALVSGMSEVSQAGFGVALLDVTGNPLIGMARGLMFHRFYHDRDATDLVYIDDDVVWERGSLTKLLRYPVDMVAGIYPKRCDPPGYTGKPIVGASLEKNGLLEMEGVPAGFLRITKRCAHKMVEAYPDTLFEAQDGSGTQGYALFESICRDGQFYGEDYAFCRRWRDLGEKVYADPHMVFMHQGFKEFTGVGPWINWLTMQQEMANGNRS